MQMVMTLTHNGITYEPPVKNGTFKKIKRDKYNAIFVLIKTLPMRRFREQARQLYLAVNNMQKALGNIPRPNIPEYKSGGFNPNKN